MINTNQWLSLSKETRAKLIELFLIPSSGIIEVETDSFGHAQVKSDGHTYADLQYITITKMQDFLGSVPANETLDELFKKVVEKIEAPEVKVELTEVVSTINITDESKITADPIESNGPLADPIPSNQLKCDQCAYETANPRGLRMHKTVKHKKIKV